MIVVRFAGFGGQGLLTAGLVLADAAIHDGKKVIQTQSYGPEARGGASRSDVIIADEEIAFPKPERLDVLVAMNQVAVDKYTAMLGEDGVLLADATFVHTVTFGDSYLIPFTALAREKFGKPFVANVVALGALVELKAVVSRAALIKALEQRVPAGALALNLQAFDAGVAAVREAAAAQTRAEQNFDIV